MVKIIFEIGDIKIKACTEAEVLTTTLPDGAEIPASPHDTAEYRRTASELGYPTDDVGITRMCFEHEITHSKLAHMLGLKESPTLRAVAEGRANIDGPAGDLYRLEETAVLAIQRFAMAAGGKIIF